MQKISPPSVLGVFCRFNCAYHRLYMVLALLSAIFINNKIGNCGDDSQNPSSGTSIVIKEKNLSGVSINDKDKTPFNELITGIATPTTVPRVVLNVDSSQEKSSPSSTIRTIREIDGKSNSTGKIPSVSIVPIQSPTATNVNIAHSQFPKPLVASETSLPREPSRLNVEAATPSSKSFPNRISLDIPPRTSQTTSQSFAAPIINSTPKPAAQRVAQQVAPPVISKPAAQIVPQQVAPPLISKPAAQIVSQPVPQPIPQPAAQIVLQQPAPQPAPQPAAKTIAQQILLPVKANPADQIVAQQVAPSFIPQPTYQIVFQQGTMSPNAKPVSLLIIPQLAPAPSPQMAMAPPVRQVKRTDPEDKKDNNGQSYQCARANSRKSAITSTALDRRPRAST